MALAQGTRLGPYEVVAPLGAGGRGEVYRGRDTRLGREVALKVLKVLHAERLSESDSIAGMYVSPDGQSILYAGARDASDLMMIENFR